MKNIIFISILIAMGTVSKAQDTAYVSHKLTTAIFFPSAVNVVGTVPRNLRIIQQAGAILTLKSGSDFSGPYVLKVRDILTSYIYRIPVIYSYGRSGRRIFPAQKSRNIFKVSTPPVNEDLIAAALANGKRKAVADHEKVGGVKAWVNKISLAGNRLFFRLDIRNKSRLPYTIDFIRFYVRDLKTVSRTATHEQEVLPVCTTFRRGATILHKKEIAGVYGFKRFSLSNDQALSIEIYERSGNRHIYLQARQSDLDRLAVINSVNRQSGMVTPSLTSL